MKSLFDVTVVIIEGEKEKRRYAGFVGAFILLSASFVSLCLLSFVFGSTFGLMAYIINCFVSSFVEIPVLNLQGSILIGIPASSIVLTWLALFPNNTNQGEKQ